jgi:hypothetical protein
MLHAAHIGKTQIDELDGMVFDQFQNIFAGHDFSSKREGT